MSFLTLVFLAQSFNLNSQYGTEAKPLVVKQNEYTLSAFGALRVAPPWAQADLTNLYGMDTAEIYGTSGAGSVASLLNESASLLTSPIAIRTHDNYRYQAGRGGLVYQTVAITTAADAGTYQWGLFDDNDGLFWEYSGNGLKFVTRSSADGGITDTKVSVDAGVGWNPALVSIYEFRYQWLGSGKTRAFISGNQVATIDNSNRWTGAYMKTAYLPLTWNVQGTSAKMKAICASVTSEGGAHPAALTYTAQRTTDLVINASSGPLPAITIRPAAFFKTVRSRVKVQPNTFWCTADSKRVNVTLVLNPATLTGPVFGAVSTTSAAEVDTTATAYTGGIPIASFGVSANGYTEQRLDMVFGETARKLRGHAFATYLGGTGFSTDLDTLVVAVENPGSGQATVRCGVEFEEER